MKYTNLSYYVYEKDGVMECTTVMPPAGRHTTRWNDVWGLIRMIDPAWQDLHDTYESLRAMTRS